MKPKVRKSEIWIKKKVGKKAKKGKDMYEHLDKLKIVKINRRINKHKQLSKNLRSK